MANQKIELENARIGWTNFAGRKGEYNNEGERFFTLFPDDETAKELELLGLNVKWKHPQDHPEITYATLQVNMWFNPDLPDDDGYQPKIYVVDPVLKTRRRYFPNTAPNISELDRVEITSADLVLWAKTWNKGNRSGVTARLLEANIVIKSNRFTQKYAEYTTL